ncbi:unnamed protein product [Mycena citricolor]|uniref:Uncharacterized protein n=1 Tax=Mycena citricolor TaxID=2018698 RepID=A0AAD2HLS9_9AGAR|nr:unnamed protein product [Mycena citricolor]CAK5277796.1 unnamed protein product [Mycena citricolor]
MLDQIRLCRGNGLHHRIHQSLQPGMKLGDRDLWVSLEYAKDVRALVGLGDVDGRVQIRGEDARVRERARVGGRSDCLLHRWVVAELSAVIIALQCKARKHVSALGP